MKKFLLAAAALALPGTANAAELITNGGFENPTVTDPCCTTTPPDPLPGWTVSPDVNVVNGTFGSSNGNLAFEGSQYLDLIGQSGGGSLSQTIATVAGLTYELNFAFSHNIFSNGSLPTSASYSVDGLSGTVSHSTGSNANLDWQTVSQRFTATGDSATLTFTNLTGTGSGGVFLDAVSISAVPEASTWAMMILGLGFVGGVMRRRRSPALKLA